VSSSSGSRKRPYKPACRGLRKHLYSYKQPRDVPVSQLSEDQFNYVVKSLLYAAVGYYDEKRKRGKCGARRVVDGSQQEGSTRDY
jgi:hypothetical protein